jgi:cell division protein FtsL
MTPLETKKLYKEIADLKQKIEDAQKTLYDAIQEINNKLSEQSTNTKASSKRVKHDEGAKQS